MHFTLIRRSVLEKMVEAYPEQKYRTTVRSEDNLVWLDCWALFQPILATISEGPEGSEYKMLWSEDFSFCERWRRIGGQVHLHCGAKLGHADVATSTGLDKFSGRLRAAGGSGFTVIKAGLFANMGGKPRALSHNSCYIYRRKKNGKTDQHIGEIQSDSFTDIKSHSPRLGR